MTEVKGVLGDEIAAMLGVTTTACDFCGNPCRVPEDVVAVIAAPPAPRRVFAVCMSCYPAIENEVRSRLEL